MSRSRPGPAPPGRAPCGPGRHGRLPAGAASSSEISPATAGSIEPGLQNVLFHKRRGKARESPARTDGFAKIPKGHGGPDTPKKGQRTALQRKGGRVGRRPRGGEEVLPGHLREFF